MRLAVGSILLLLLMAFQWEKPSEEPMFFEMAEEWKQVVNDDQLIEFSGKDTFEIHQVRLLSDENKRPLLFFSDLETGVCADGECKLANIKIYWNLLGNYVGYGIYPDLPLTKFEHDPFTSQDYQKLHQLLGDQNSILRRKEMDELVDKVPIKSRKARKRDIDGMSAATKRDIKEAVVEGGLYSCYTLWHLVYGEAQTKMKHVLDSIQSDELNQYFLYSEYADYRSYALKQMDESHFLGHAEQVVKIFEESQPLVRTYLLKKVPGPFLADEKVSQRLYKSFPGVDVNTRTQLIKKLDMAHPMAAELLSENLSEMTSNQLKLYLAHLKDSGQSLSELVKTNLQSQAAKRQYTYSFMIEEFLKSNGL
ncbi:MAG: hypothetical protein RIG77_19180 [Cyclobacteriaceae bacterium]